MVAIVDYGVGNLFSLQSSFQAIGAPSVVTSDPEVLLSADRVVLPGVGAFGDAADRLRQSGLDATVKAVAAQGTPLLGICLGMQLLLDRSFEFALAEYGAPITAAVARGNVMGCQFHPEKSGPVGLSILRAFWEGEGA